MPCGASSSRWRRTSTARVARSQPGLVSTPPRAISCALTPLRFTATRLPGVAASIFCRCDCSPRMRPCTPPGTISTGCPASSEPSMSVPVTTVPNPATANERSTGRRGRPTSRRCCVSSSAASIADASSCTPSPVVAETACTRRARERRRRQQLLDLQLHQGQDVGVREVGLRDDREPAPHAEQVEYRQVLARLRHHRLVRRDDQQREVDAADAREHVLDEPLVARHVHDAHLAPAGQRHPREAEVDGHAAPLLLGEAVRVDARERLHERRLPVVDVACRADDVHAASIAGAIMASPWQATHQHSPAPGRSARPGPPTSPPSPSATGSSTGTSPPSPSSSPLSSRSTSSRPPASPPSPSSSSSAAASPTSSSATCRTGSAATGTGYSRSPSSSPRSS